MKIGENELLDALKATIPYNNDTVENAFTANELMEKTGMSQDAVRAILKKYIIEGRVGITKVWRKSVLGGYNTRVPAYYYINLSS